MSTLADEQFAVWSTAYVNDLPDSAFLYIESGGTKDGDGKTAPRSLRHFPYKDANGKVDLPHLRNALARIPQSNLPADVKKSVTAKAEKILAQNGGGDNDGDETSRTAELEMFVAAAPLTHVEVRDPSANPDNTWTMSGYAAVFNEQAVLHKLGQSELRVTIAPDAFAKVLRTQQFTQPDGVVHFNLGHDMNRAVAATNVPAGQPGSLTLKVDAHGLGFLAKASRDDPDAQKMAVGMRDGYIAQASMAFASNRKAEEFTELDDYTLLRRINEIDLLADVCATPQGVFPMSTAQLQQFSAQLGQPHEFVGGQPRQPSDGGASFVSPEKSGGVAGDRRREIARFRRDLARIRK